MGGYAISMNRFLSLTLALIISVTSTLRPNSFPSVTPLVPRFLPPFPTWPVRFAPLCLLSGWSPETGQGLPGRIYWSFYASSKMSRMLGLGGVGSVSGVVTGGRSGAAASVSTLLSVSFV